MGVTLGLCLGFELYVPAVTFVLCAGFMSFHLAFRARGFPGGACWRAAGALLMVGSLSAVFYIVVFLPHFLLGCGADADLFHYSET